MFAVLYKFKIKSGMEAKFENTWAEMTLEFRAIHGGLGSCLHKDESGNFMAYARWPSRQLWEKDKKIVNIEAMNSMKECVEQSFPAIPLEITNDLLLK